MNLLNKITNYIDGKLKLIDNKFIDQIYNNNYQVLTDDGFKHFSGIGKTKKFKVYEITTFQNNKLLCADNHILKDNKYNNVFVKNLKPFDSILTKNGNELIKSVKILNKKHFMYDLLNVKDKVYLTNDILSHNTTTYEVFVTHYILFNSDKNVAILANKAATAKKILKAIKKAYEGLPKFLQQGVEKWNEMSIELENGTICSAYSTSGDSIRGDSCNVLIIDECISKRSKLKLKNKITSEIVEKTIEELYKTL